MQEVKINCQGAGNLSWEELVPLQKNQAVESGQF